MVTRDIEMANALAECLEAARRGPEALRETLDRYPAEWQEELALLVQLAISIPAASEESAPSVEWRARTKDYLLRKIQGQDKPAAIA